jgi:hypothetical protein
MTTYRTPSKRRRKRRGGGSNGWDFMMFLLVWVTAYKSERSSRKSAPLIPLPKTPKKKQRKGANTGGGGSGGSSHTGVGPADGVYADKAQPGWYQRHTKSRSAKEEWKPYAGIDLDGEEEAQVIDEDDPNYVHEFEVVDDEDVQDLEYVDGIVAGSGERVDVDMCSASATATATGEATAE